MIRISSNSDRQIPAPPFRALIAVCLTVLSPLLLPERLSAQESDSIGIADKTPQEARGQGRPQKHNAIRKNGLSFGPLPIISYDAMKGAHLGAMLHIYDFGDGKSYPDPICSWYAEASVYTGGSQTYVASFDSGSLFGDIRIDAAASYSRDNAMEFFGYNGSQSIYDRSRSNTFYRFSRSTLDIKADVSGRIAGHLHWDVGYHFNLFGVSPYAKEEKSLFGQYLKWGIIASDGNFVSSAIRTGLTYDSRNHKGVPDKGIYADAHIIGAANAIGSTDNYLKYNLTWRQFVPLWKGVILAYRIDWHSFIGKAPWYAIPFYTPAGPIYDNSAIGGYRTVRGLLYNRVLGPGTGLANIELRWKLAEFTFWRQNIALMFSGFTDGVKVFYEYDTDNRTGADPELYETLTDRNSKDRLHVSLGGSLKIIINANFVLNVEYARCTSREDGGGVLYLNTGFYF